MTIDEKQYLGSLQGLVSGQIERHSRAEIDSRVEALRLANGCAGYDNDPTQTIKRAEAYLKFLQGTAT